MNTNVLKSKDQLTDEEIEQKIQELQKQQGKSKRAYMDLSGLTPEEKHARQKEQSNAAAAKRMADPEYVAKRKELQKKQ